MKPVALGFRAHSGWAALVVVGGTKASPVVVDRRRIVLADPKIAGSVQPYHAAGEAKTPREAAALVRRYQESSGRLAVRALDAVGRDLAAGGAVVVGAGILLASGRPLPALDGILASHALIHAADGEHFRDALAEACESARVPVIRVRERELEQQAATVLRRPAADLRATVAALGRPLGPPWTQDQKSATLVAWLALARAERRPA